MANDLFYIPLDIGAWMKDTSCVSMDTQGCLLNILFKLWDAKEKGSFCFAFDQLSILLKKTHEECLKTLEEIQKNDLLNVHFQDGNMVLLESRRMLKKADKSLKMSLNGKKGGRPKKQIESKLKAKEKQIPKYNSNFKSKSDNESKGGAGGKTKTTAQIAFDLIPETFHGDEFVVLWDDYEKLRKQKKKPLTETAVKQRVGQLVTISGGEWGIAKASMEETISSGWDRFFAPNSSQSSKPSQNGRIRDKF